MTESVIYSFENDNEEAHWYAADGRPVYEVQRSDGLGVRPTTVLDANKLNLLPSVTTILGMLYKPGLQQWLFRQYVMAALTLPRDNGESLDDFAGRVVKDARSEGYSAAAQGTRIHKIIEWWLALDKGQAVDLPDDITLTERMILVNFNTWAEENQLQPESLEHAFSHFADASPGYGGRIDCIGNVNGQRCVIDWKTQETQPKQPIKFYPEWGAQLAAYAYGIGEPDLPGLSVVLSRNEPHRILSYLWMERWRWPAFEALKFLYHTPLGGGYRLNRNK